MVRIVKTYLNISGLVIRQEVTNEETLILALNESIMTLS